MPTVNEMPWIDTDGDTGVYSGQVNEANVPDGVGQMNYDDGPVVKGRWKEGEMVIEEEGGDDHVDDRRRPLNTIESAEEEEDVEELKRRQLQEFHERNQQFLKSQNQYQQQQQTETQEEIHAAELQQLHHEIYVLHEQIGELTHELRITQESHQLAKDQSSAEITMLRTELDRQNSRHEQIASSLRNRLVESEVARTKMQDQLSARMEEDARREEELKAQWNEMTRRVLEDKKWVDEQMIYWKESMEEHRRRLGVAKARGGLDAEAGGGGDGRGGAGGSPPKSGAGERKRTGDEEKDRRLSQRKLWGAYSDSDDSDDEEELRMFGVRGTSMRHLPSAARR